MARNMTVALFLLAASTALAAPFDQASRSSSVPKPWEMPSRRYETIGKRVNTFGKREYGDGETDDNTDESSICGHDDTTWDDRQIASDVWWSTGAGYWLDSWIDSRFLSRGLSPDNWLQTLNDEHRYAGATGHLWECATLGGQCIMEGECSDYFMNDEEIQEMQDMPQEEQSVSIAVQYYINYAATKVHEAYAEMDNKLTNWGVETGFNIDKIIEDFGESEETDIWALMSAAFGIASGLTAGSTPVSGAAAAFSGVFSMVDTLTEPEDESADLKARVGQYFSAAKDTLQQTLNNAFGVDDYNMDDLPMQTEEYYNDTPLGRFFADGKWLMNNVAAVLEPAIERGNQIMSGGIAVSILAASDYFIYVDTSVEEEGDCTGTSRHWVDDMCFGLVERTEYGCTPTSGYTTTCDLDFIWIDDEKWTKLTTTEGDATYAVDAYAMYPNAYECKKANPDGSDGVDASTIPYDGSYAPCFYNIDVKKGYVEMGELKEEDL